MKLDAAQKRIASLLDGQVMAAQELSDAYVRFVLSSESFTDTEVAQQARDVLAAWTSWTLSCVETAVYVRTLVREALQGLDQDPGEGDF